MYKNKIKIVLTSLLAAGMISACAPVPPLNFSVPNVGVASRKIPAEMKSLTVSVARPDEKKGEMPIYAPAIANLWEKSLTESLNKMVVFQDDGDKKVNLAVKILKLDVPGAGASMTTNVAARYEIIDRKNGDIIFTQDIDSTGVVPFDYAFQGATRQVESVNRAVQNNITLFLQALETVNIDRVMFPAKLAK